MDVASLVKLVAEAGPSVGIGLAAGLLVMIGGLFSEKLVMGGRFWDMREQRNNLQREKDGLVHDNRSLESQNSELRVMLAGALNVARKNAHLSTSVMQRAATEREDALGTIR